MQSFHSTVPTATSRLPVARGCIPRWPSIRPFVNQVVGHLGRRHQRRAAFRGKQLQLGGDLVLGVTVVRLFGMAMPRIFRRQPDGWPAIAGRCRD